MLPADAIGMLNVTDEFDTGGQHGPVGGGRGGQHGHAVGRDRIVQA